MSATLDQRTETACVGVRTAAQKPSLLLRCRYIWIAMSLALAVRLELAFKDWGMLLHGGKALLTSHGLHVYVDEPDLQAGPPSLLATVGLDRAAGGHGVFAAHVVLSLAFLLILWAAERTALVMSRAKLSAPPVARALPVPPIALVLALGMLPIWGHWAQPHSLPRTRDLVVVVPLVLAALQLWQRRRSDRPVPVGPALQVRILLLGMLAAPLWAFLAGTWPHIDDALTMVAVAAAMYAIAAAGPTRAGLAIGLAIAFKPWGIAALPMIFGLREGRRRALFWSLIIPALSWAPFVIAAPATLGAAGRHFALLQGSTLAVFGLPGPYAPSWLRAVELGASLAAAIVVARRGEWFMAFAAGMAFRILLDPATFIYYFSTALLAIAVGDLLGRRVPWRTLLFAAAIWLIPFASNGHPPLWIRPWLLVALAASYVVSPAYLHRFITGRTAEEMLRRMRLKPGLRAADA